MKINIYKLVDPRDNNIFYVGQTLANSPRIYRHKQGTSDDHIRKIVQELHDLDLLLITEVVASCDTNDEARVLERHYQDLYVDQGHTLMNVNRGGTPGPRGHTQGTTHRNKLSLSSSGNTNASGPRDQAFKNTMLGNTRGQANAGVPHSDDRKQKISDTLSGRTLPYAHKANIGDGVRGTIHTEQARKNMSGPKSESHRKNMSIAQTGKKHLDVTKKKLSDALKGRKCSPETIRKRQLSCHNKHAGKNDFLPELFVTTRRQCPLCTELLGLTTDSVTAYVDSKRIQSQATIDKKTAAYAKTRKETHDG